MIDLLFTEQSKPAVKLATIDQTDDGGFAGTFVITDRMVSDEDATDLAPVKISFHLRRSQAGDYGRAEEALWRMFDGLVKKIANTETHYT